LYVPGHHLLGWQWRPQGENRSGIACHLQGWSLSFRAPPSRCPVTAQLSDLHLQLRFGELCLVAGDAGAGKSLFLRALLDSALTRSTFTSGVATVCASRSGWCDGDQPALSSALSVSELLVHIGRFHCPPSEQLCRPLELQAQQLLEALDIAHLATRYVGGAFARGVSSGELRRVQLACALMTRSRLLLLDDALVGLDAARALRLLTLLADLCCVHAITCVVSVKQLALPPQVWQLAHRMLLLQRGQQVYFGPAKPSALHNYLQEQQLLSPAVVPFDRASHSPDSFSPLARELVLEEGANEVRRTVGREHRSTAERQ
jgi:ABC-type multidrug transport system ATPase subunit